MYLTTNADFTFLVAQKMLLTLFISVSDSEQKLAMSIQYIFFTYLFDRMFTVSLFCCYGEGLNYIFFFFFFSVTFVRAPVVFRLDGDGYG